MVDTVLETVSTESVTRIQLSQPREEELFLQATSGRPEARVDDVNPAITRGAPFGSRGADRPRHPSGMLMGPDDPFFREIHGNPGVPMRGNVRYDIIGPFGQEPDPDIDFPRGNVPFPKRGPDFRPPGDGMFFGNNPFGGGFH